MKLMDYGDVEIHVGEDGRFRAEVDGHEMKSEKLDLLQKRLDKAVADGRRKCSVPLTLFDGDGKPLLRGHVTGIHRGTGNYIFSDGGSTKQLREFDLRHKAVAATAEQEAELLSRHRAVQEADRHYDHMKFELRDGDALFRVRKALGEVK